MNPFTRSLILQINDRRLVDFIEQWDRLEGLVIAVYKAGAATPAQSAEYARLRAVLLKVYPRWAAALAGYWPHARQAGEPARQDPFAALLAISNAGLLAGNWEAMQTLPAAREALNRFLVDQLPQTGK